MFQLVAILLAITTTAIGSDDKTTAPSKIEFRRAENKPAEGLTEATDLSKGEKIYLHNQVEMDNKDIASIKYVFDSGTPTLDVIVTIVERLKLSRSTVYTIIETYGTKKGLKWYESSKQFHHQTRPRREGSKERTCLVACF